MTAKLTQSPVVTTDVEQTADTLTGLGLTEVAIGPDGVSAVLGSAREQDVVAALVGAGVPVRGFVAERPDLEEVFVGLTGSGFDVSG